MTPPALATIGVTPIYGSGLDSIVGRAIRFATGTKNQYSHWDNATVNHSVVFVGMVNAYGAVKPQLMEADPIQGYRLADWDKYGDNMIWLDRIGQMQEDHSLVELSPSPAQRIAMVNKSLGLRGIKYNFADILAIAWAQQRLHPYDPDFHEEVKKYLIDTPWWLDKVTDDDRLICSQASDLVWDEPGLGLFKDMRIHGLVSPADLLSLRITAGT